MNKKGIELSINVFVVIILSLIMLSGGVYLLRSFIVTSIGVESDLDAMTQEQLERLLVDEGRQVALPFFSAELEAGDTHIYGLGILNIDEDEFGDSFSITIEPAAYVNLDGKSGTITDLAPFEKWLLYNTNELTIKENQHVEEAILVEVPNGAEKGTYIFDVKVMHSPDNNNDQYDATKKLYVIVK
ncbi:hypothetical protein HOC13_04635 [Candidatus Woesearchaeota archaeon]|jgi:hypothetical protein|nr:hypothetical protein [Candidatus Woesearchaeota archaeon]